MDLRPPDLHNTPASEILAMMELMYFVAVADGEFCREERREFLERIEALSEGKIRSSQLNGFVEHLERQPVEDLPTRLASLAQMLPDESSRRIAYGLALQMSEANGERKPVELDVLHQIALALQLPDEDEEHIAHSVRSGPRSSSRPRSGD